ncbi:PREDICTED: uncharacterized protein LOC109472727 [Branchiostoma belcheri]|uniref:Uncharacterized protein LOC109472727 n=1 Tax=Branchiostoma belcheri TaxID=7741 RepID=A0A6P4ZEP0_BRABE|nr:PREDICTED: uncharacterized protein LOC109472727 [Branchiostoma belcheri]
MTHRSESGKWCLLDHGPDGIDLKWISSTGSIKWLSDQMAGPISDLHVPKDGDSTSVMVSYGKQKALKMPLAMFRGAEDCGEEENCFSELNSNMSQVDFIKMFTVIKDAVFADWKPKQLGVTRKPLEEVSSNQKRKTSPQPGNTSTVSRKSPVKRVFQSVSSTSRASRSPVKSPKKIIRHTRQKREMQMRSNIAAIGGTPGTSKSPTEMEEESPTEMEEEEEDTLVNIPAKRQMSIQKSPGKSAKEMEEEEAVHVNPAKRQRLSTSKSTKKRDFQDGVIAMREALIADMDTYEELDDNQSLPAPSSTVKAQWTDILQYKEYREISNNAKEYRVVAQLSKRCWTKVLHIFQLCHRNDIVTKERRASFLMFRPLRGRTESEMYKILSTYVETAYGAKMDVKTLINTVTNDMEMDKLPTSREMVADYRKMKSQLQALKEQGISLEEAAQQREKIRELEAELTQLRMFAVDVAQTVNSSDKPEVKIDHIKGMLEIDSFLDPTTGGFAMELSLSKVEGHPSLHMTDEFSPGFSSTMLNGDFDAYEAFEDTDNLNSEKAAADDQGTATDNLMLEMAAADDQGTATNNLMLEKAAADDQGTATDNLMLEMAAADDQGTATDNLMLEKAAADDQGTATDNLNSEKAAADDQGTATDNLNSEKATADDQGTATDNLMLEMDQDTDNLNLDKDRWVAVALEVPEGWHIAKLESTEGNKACVSFLQTGIPRVYKWPSLTDKLVVNIKCIIDKDVEMTPSGTGTRQYWRMSIATSQRLNMLFDEFKVNYW